MDTRKLVLSIDRCEPEVEELPGGSSLLRFHDVQSGSRVIKDGVYEDFQVCKTKCLGDGLIDEGKSSVDDDMEILEGKTR